MLHIHSHDSRGHVSRLYNLLPVVVKGCSRATHLQVRNDVSEFADRAQEAEDMMYNANPETLTMLKRDYGWDKADFMAAMVDPEFMGTKSLAEARVQESKDGKNPFSDLEDNGQFCSGRRPWLGSENNQDRCKNNPVTHYPITICSTNLAYVWASR